MSWSRRSALALATACASGVLLAGCFQPLYSGALDPNGENALAAIAVAPISDRLGYYLANELTFRFTGGGEKPAPRYKLIIKISERAQTPLVDTVSGRATAAILGVDAEYRLESTADARVIATGTAFVTESYDRSSQRFANTRAARDAEIRGAKSLADQIFTRLAVALRAGG